MSEIPTSKALRLRSERASATTYSFVVDGDRAVSGWACCTVNDVSGELTITSDWGNWAFRWGTWHLGVPTLTEFLADRDSYDYIACKLIDSDRLRVFDVDKSIRELKIQLLTVRRGEEISKESARAIWEWLDDLKDLDDERAFLDELGRKERLDNDFGDYLDEARKVVCDDVWEHAKHSDGREYRDLTTIILPALVQACTATHRRRKALLELQTTLFDERTPT